MKTYQLHILRHGLTQGNLDGLYIGHTDVPLCSDAISQIEAMTREMSDPMETWSVRWSIPILSLFSQVL